LTEALTFMCSPFRFTVRLTARAISRARPVNRDPANY
jgi:hypothetical protein